MEEFVEATVSNLVPLERSFDLSNLDAIVVLGRGVQKNFQGGWEVTSLMGEGIGERMKHTGVTSYIAKPEDDNVIVKGGNANIRAVYEIIKSFHGGDKRMPEVIFAAGIPDYLVGTGISEGEIMKNRLVKLLNRDGINGVNITILDQAKSTIDDIQNSIKFSGEKGHKKVGIVTIKPHIPRSWLMTKKVLFELGALFGSITEIGFIDSFSRLAEVNERYKTLLANFENTAAYKRMLPLEADAIANLKQSGVVR